MRPTSCPTASGSESCPMSRIRSAASGASYGDETPVKSASSPRRARVHSFWIACLANRERCADIHLEKPRFADEDERGDHDQPGVVHQAGHFGDPANVLATVRWRESEVAVQAVPNVVAVKYVTRPTTLVQLTLQCEGEC